MSYGMNNQVFLVVADSESAEQCYSSIIHKEHPLSCCVTISELIDEYGGDSSSLGEYIKALLLNPKIRKFIFFLKGGNIT